jgi:ABC-2 type transport system permease protein
MSAHALEQPGRAGLPVQSETSAACLRRGDDPADRPPVPRHGHATRAAATLVTRLVRRGTLLLAVAMAAYAALEIASYRTAYPDGVSPVQFAMFEDNPAVRMLNGVPAGLDTAAGFALWDAGWMWQLLLAVWAILTTTRLLRGEEDLDRADLVLAGPLRATRATAVTLAVIVAAGSVVGIATALTLVMLGQPAVDSILLGVALASFSATFVGVAAVTSQLVDVRRRAAGLAAAVLGVAWVLRMVANSADSRAWLRWSTPMGWIDELALYAGPAPLALLPLVVVPVLLAAGAVALRARRDIDAALLVAESGRPPRLRGLGGPLAFAWRSNRAVLLAWVVGLAAYSAVMGGLLGTMIEWLAGDEGYQQLLAAMGLDAAASNKGFLAFIATMIGLAVCLQVSWRLGSARAEEESGRLEGMLARPVGRWRWLAGHATLAGLGAALLVVVAGLSLWLGAVAVGSSEIVLGDALRAAGNVGPVVTLVAGLGIATFGLVPRLTVALPVVLTVVGYVLAMIGPALDWPQWVLDLSPFTHLALVPAQPWAATSGAVMLALGVLSAAVGFLAFSRRDVTTA